MSHLKLPPSERHPVVHKLLDGWPPSNWLDLHVVLAVSGGADSVALLRAMLEARATATGTGKLIVAHLNHHLRADADAEAEWVAKLCRQLDVPLESDSVATPLAGADRTGVETAARTARYEFLRTVAERLGARYVVTAHTADDQVETVLHRVIRGTGLAGLAGMAAARPLSPSVALVRPLLGVWRREIEDYLQSLGQTYCIDSSNEDVAFTRNRIRNRLLDQLRRDFNPDVNMAIVRLAQQASEAQSLIDAYAQQLYVEHVQAPAGENRIVLATSMLAQERPILVRELCKLAWTRAGWPLQAMGFCEWDRLASLLMGAEGKCTINLPASVRATRLADVLVLARIC
jgi:tRNA(Ile)-lysidine synthase